MEPDTSYLDNPTLAPIRPLMLDPDITELMINGPGQVYVERAGQMQPADVRFDSEDDLRRVIEVLLRPSGRAISSATPYADFRLPDGSRGNVVIPPIATNGSAVTIRKFTLSLRTVEDLVGLGTLSERMARLLGLAVAGRANVIFAGAAGTGKTTTLNIFSKFIPATERIITIEDTAELHLQQRHVVSLECRRANLEGRGEVRLAELVRNSLRMRPTRIIVGEVRGEEAVDMLQAIATGHEGCLAVLHASSPADAVSRLEMMSLARGPSLPMWAIQRQIASAIDLVVQHEILTDGSRRITRMTELAGVDGDRIALNDLFRYRRLGEGPNGRERGEWIAGDTRPQFADRCERMGLAVPEPLYATGSDPAGPPAR